MAPDKNIGSDYTSGVDSLTFGAAEESPPLLGGVLLRRYRAVAPILLGESDVESRASGSVPSAPPCGNLSGEPRELDMDPRLKTDPDLSKTIHLPSKEPSAMP